MEAIQAIFIIVFLVSFPVIYAGMLYLIYQVVPTCLKEKVKDLVGRSPSKMVLETTEEYK